MQVPPPIGLDPNFVFNQVMPIVGLLAVFVGLRWVFRSPVGEALAERIRMRTGGRWGVGGGCGGGGGDLIRSASPRWRSRWRSSRARSQSSPSG